jgi:hypothetical protein
MKKSLLAVIVLVLTIMMASSALGAQVAQWTFDEGSGTTFADSYGNYNGTIINSTGNVAWRTDGPVGDGSLELDNPGDSIVIADNGGLEFAGDFTVSAWIKPKEISDRFLIAKSRSWSDVYSRGYQLRMDGWGRKLMWYAGGNYVFDDAVFLYGLEENKWYHIIGMRDGNQAKLYVNGMLIGTQSGLAPISYNGVKNLTLGSVDNGPTWSAESIFEQVEFYDTALSQGEIDSLYSPYIIEPTEPISAEYLYAPTTDTLRVQGYADIPAVSASVRFIDSTGAYATTSTCVAVDQDENPEYEASFTNVAASWALDTYNLEVVFFDENNCGGSALSETAYGGEFDALMVIAIEQRLDTLNATIQALNGTFSSNLTAIWMQLDEVEINLTAVWNQLDALEAQINAMNHGTINLHHTMTVGVNDLTVFGEAPEGATVAQVALVSLDGLTTYSSGFTVPVTTVLGNENYYTYTFDLDALGVEPLKYNVDVSFSGMPGYTVSALFDDLFILWLDERLTQTELDLIELNETLGIVNETLWNETREIREILNSMNHGTVYAFAYYDTLFEETMVTVLGEAPEGAEEVEILFYDTSYGSVHSEGPFTIGTTPGNPNKFSRTVFASDLGDDLYIVKVNFYDGDDNKMTSYSVSTPLNTLYLFDLEERVTTLEAQVKYIQGDLDLTWNSETQTLKAKVHFPYGATVAHLHVYDSDDNKIDSYSITNIPAPGSAPYEVDRTWDVSDWAVDTYTIKVNFPDAPDAYKWRAEFFDKLLIEWLEEQTLGFELMHTTTFEVWNPQDTFVREILWAITVEESGDYRFELIDLSSGDLYKDYGIFSLTSHQEDLKIQKNVRLPPREDRHKVKLRATQIGGAGLVYESNKFWLIVDDLAQPWPVSSAGVREITVAGYNVGSDTYWTSSSAVDAAADLISDLGWSETNGCLVKYVDRGLAPWFLEKDGTNGTCNGTIRLTADYVGAASAALESGETTQVFVCATPVNGEISYAEVCGNVTIGYDITPPVINFIYPGEQDKLSGTTTFRIDVTDDGELAKVNVTLVNKTDANDTHNFGLATYNASSGLWERVVNTTQVPDGWYNISVEAIDFAGNWVIGVLDPLVDNTEPEVVSISMSGYAGAEGGFTISALLTDNLAGVKRATAYLYPYESCNEDFVAGTCTLSWCEPQSNTSEECTNETVYLPGYDDCMQLYCSGEVVPENCEENFCGAFINETTNCTNVTEQLPDDCSFTATCDNGLAVEECLEDENATAEDCYQDHCPDYKAYAVEPFDQEVSCERNCFATTNCTNVSTNATVNVSLNFTGEGDVLDGVWRGTLPGDALESGTHYKVVIVVEDDANTPNVNTMANQEATAEQFFSNTGFTVTIATSVDELFTSDVFVVSGTVVDFDGNPVTTSVDDEQSVMLYPWGVSSPLQAGIFSRQVLLTTAGEQEVSVRYTPFEGCIDQWYVDAETTITVNGRPNSGGGGGGGSFTRDDGNTAVECDDGYERVGDDCVRIEEESEESSEGGSQPVQSGTSDNDQGNAPIEEEAEEPAPSEENLLTGAVTGGGFGGWAWAGIIVGLIVLLLLAYLIVRRSK